MNGVGAPGIVRAQQDRRQECAAGNRRLGVGIARDDPRSSGFQLAMRWRTSSRWLTLTSAPMRVSSARGSPTLVFASRSASACLDRVEILRGRHGAADGGAFLTRLDRHLGRDFLDEQVELGRAGRRVRAEQRRVEAVLLGDEADRLRA